MLNVSKVLQHAGFKSKNRFKQFKPVFNYRANVKGLLKIKKKIISV